MAVDKQALYEAAMRFIRKMIKEAKETYDYDSWSLKVFEDMYMTTYDADMPVKHGLFRLFLDFLGGMFKSVRGNIVLHDLGSGSGDVVELINGMPVFEVRYFDTHLFSVTRPGGLVSSYILLRGEGEYGQEGDEAVTADDLFDLTGCLSQVLDEAMSDTSGNGVQNRVIKKYVDGWIEDVIGRLRQPDWDETSELSMAFIKNKPVALTWRPSVDADGNLSWTASLNDRTPPPAVNIRGPKGEDIKGTNGLTPHVGENGNWWIGETDTGVKAKGSDGIGNNGLTPEIGVNDNWWIGGVDTGKPSRGQDGAVLPGTIVMWSGNEIPEGWKECDGTYAESLGRDVPDLRGRCVFGRHAENNRFKNTGNTGGEETHRLTPDEQGAFSFELRKGQRSSHDNNVGAYEIEGLKLLGGTTKDPEAEQQILLTSDSWGDTLGWVHTTGSSGQRAGVHPTNAYLAHENMPPYYVLVYIIKL